MAADRLLKGGAVADCMRGRVLRVLVFAAMLSLAACASPNHQVLLGGSGVQNHAASPRIVIGIEKFAVPTGPGRIAYNAPPGPHCDRSSDRCIDLVNAGLPAELQDLWADRLDDRTQQAVTHIVELNEAGDCASVHFSAYGPGACTGAGLAEPVIAAEESWRLFDADGPVTTLLEQRIAEHRITHIIVLTTGWRVQQEGTLRTTAEWIRNINASFDDEGFRPLYILLTWPAYRTDRHLSFLNKGHDADEVGLTWANVLVNRTLATVRDRTNVNVVLIGHSFGARLLSTATFSARTIGAPNCGGPDLLIGLQAAFSNGRFFGSGDRDNGAYVIDGCRAKAAYTISGQDGGLVLAPTQFFGTSRYMGGASTLRRFDDGEGADVFETRTTEPPNRERVLLLNGDQAICNHNDVTNPWVAWQIASLINDYATNGARLTLKPPPNPQGCH